MSILGSDISEFKFLYSLMENGSAGKEGIKRDEEGWGGGYRCRHCAIIKWKLIGQIFSLFAPFICQSIATSCSSFLAFNFTWQQLSSCQKAKSRH